MDQLFQLQGQFPNFWKDQLIEETGFQSLLLAYSYVYGAALQKWKMIKNELSPFTIDPYKIEYYKVIDIRNTVTPSDSGLDNSGNFYYELPLNTFMIDVLSRDINFTDNPFSYNILYDKTLNKTLLEVPAFQLTATDRYLYIRELDIDNGNVANTYGSLFLDIQPYLNPNLMVFGSETSNYVYINSGNYQMYMLSVKAQIINFIRCANYGGTVDALENIISIAMQQPYVTEDGIIIAFDNSNTFIESNGVITQYNVSPKPRFRQQNARIYAYEAPGICPVNIYSWVMNPARFTQALLYNYSSNLFNMLTLASNEEPNPLHFDQVNLNFDPSDGELTFDFGIFTKSSDAFTVSEDYSTPNYGEIHDFSEWTNITLNKYIYEFFKNLMMVEIPQNNGGEGAPVQVIDEEWLSKILEFFRPLHSKYLIISNNFPPHS